MPSTTRWRGGSPIRPRSGPMRPGRCRRSTMSKTKPTASAVLNTMARATTSISPPARSRSTPGRDPMRGWLPSQRTSQRSSTSGSAGSGASANGQRPHHRAASDRHEATTSGHRHRRRAPSVGRPEALAWRRHDAEDPVDHEGDGREPHEDGPQRRAGHLAQGAVDPLRLVRPELDGSPDQQPADEPGHDAAADPTDPPERDDRLAADRTDIAGLELVAERRVAPLTTKKRQTAMMTTPTRRRASVPSSAP